MYFCLNDYEIRNRMFEMERLLTQKAPSLLKNVALIFPIKNHRYQQQVTKARTEIGDFLSNIKPHGKSLPESQNITTSN